MTHSANYVRFNPRLSDTWTDERILLLLKLDAENELSRAQIADEMHKQTGAVFSRNAIIGKLRRLGVPLRQVGVAPPTFVRPKRFPKPGWVAPSRSIKPPVIVLRDSLMLSLDELTPTACRYPTSPQGLPIRFCGHEIDKGSYCAAHYKICYHAGSPVNRMANIRRHKEELLKKVIKPACEAA